MEGKPNTPDIAHFNIVTAYTALVLGLTFALPPSTGQHATEIFGVRFSFDFNLYALFPVFIAVIVLAGSAWVLSGHTASKEKPLNLWTLLPNVILPGLSVFILSITLREMARSGTWWVVYVLGSLLFVLVLLAEYNVLDTQSETHPAAALGLVALSFIDHSLGGAGYLPRAVGDFDRVAQRAIQHLEHANCETACYRCLKSYTNQRHHDKHGKRRLLNARQQRRCHHRRHRQQQRDLQFCE